eukprot:gnl/TRDRNA2_/TRDRNA2_185476_c0_seq1.p1 gnl/TRDRNA2_/TRDRNA2_185476_c0~~gnl/TRDRNA2_/TRDRNA2_185476_c0_seq1.p1  ORF type:complete len:456 (+),score=68.36 gnl/TRDRNA2_/TRDRNA2_185476_c0_seq1:67-1434(+)
MEGSPRWARYVAEFFGTFLLVFTVGCNVICGSPVWGPTSIACVLMVNTYALSSVSGAHLNPAVTLAVCYAEKMKWTEALIYSLIQVAGGLFGALGYALLLGDVFNLAPPINVGWPWAGAAEFVYTFMLCFVFLNVSLSKQHADNNEFYGLAVGFVMVAGGYAAGHLSGACFNPAVAIGIDTSSALIGFGWCIFYTLCELFAAFAAAIVFRICRPDDYGHELDRTGYPMYSRLTGEFVGTYMLVLTVGLNVLGKSPAPYWSIAAALTCMSFALSSCSGAHFNPAVTASVVFAGRGKAYWLDAASYTTVQMLAGFIAGYSYKFMEGGESFALRPSSKYGWIAIAVAEIIFTAVLCFAMLSVATVKNHEKVYQYTGFVMGSCFTCGGYAVGAISGGVLNPAIAIGIAGSDILSGGPFWPCLAYIAFQLVGAGLAAGVFMATHPSEYRKRSAADDFEKI